MIDMGAYEARFVYMSVALGDVVPASAAPEGVVAYTLHFSNTGTITATNVVITNVLPAELVGVAVDPDLDGSFSLISDPNTAYLWSIGDVLPGEGGTMTVSVAVDELSTAGSVTIDASIGATADGRAGNNADSTTLTVLNAAPTANAGQDHDVATGSSGALNGTLSSDPNRDTLTYSWTQTSGPTVTLSDASSAKPTFTAPGTPGVLLFSLTVSDPGGLTSTPDQVTVNVRNVPIADLVATNDGPTRLTDSTTLTATISAGSNAIYSWDFGDGSSGDGDIVEHTYSATGTYTAVVTVSNDTSTLPAGASADFVANVLVAQTVVQVTNAQPIANAGTDQGVAPGASVTLNGSLSQDPDGHLPMTFAWTQTSGPTVALSDASSFKPTFDAPDDDAILIFELVVTDATGLASAADPVTITVHNRAITGLTATNNSPMLVGATTTLTATITAGEEVVYSWDFGDGSSGEGALVEHTYAAAGIYTATVTASNETNSLVAITLVTITRLNQIPDAVNDDTHTLMDTPIAMDVILNDTDPDGDMLSVIALGEAQHGITFQNGATALYTPTLGFIGRDTYTYTVSDGRGGTDTAIVSVRVVEEVNELVVTPDEETTETFDTLLPTSAEREGRAAVRVTISLPANSVTDTLSTDLFEVDFAWVDSSDQAEPPANLIRSLLAFSTEAFKNLILLPEYNFNGEILITLSYDPADLDGLDLSTLEIRLWDHLNQVWVEEGVRIVSNNITRGARASLQAPAMNELVIATTQTGEFAIFGQAIVPTALDEIDEPTTASTPQLYLPLLMGGE